MRVGVAAAVVGDIVAIRAAVAGSRTDNPSVAAGALGDKARGAVLEVAAVRQTERHGVVDGADVEVGVACTANGTHRDLVLRTSLASEGQCSRIGAYHQLGVVATANDAIPYLPLGGCTGSPSQHLGAADGQVGWVVTSGASLEGGKRTCTGCATRIEGFTVVGDGHRALAVVAAGMPHKAIQRTAAEGEALCLARCTACTGDGGNRAAVLKHLDVSTVPTVVIRVCHRERQLARGGTGSKEVDGTDPVVGVFGTADGADVCHIVRAALEGSSAERSGGQHSRGCIGGGVTQGVFDLPLGGVAGRPTQQVVFGIVGDVGRILTGGAGAEAGESAAGGAAAVENRTVVGDGHRAFVIIATSCPNKGVLRTTAEGERFYLR